MRMSDWSSDVCFSDLLAPHALASRPVSNGEWQEFIADGGYHTPALWLSDGWAWVQAEDVEAPAYWQGDQYFTLAGWHDIDPAAPVPPISFFEADRSEERRVGKEWVSTCISRVFTDH